MYFNNGGNNSSGGSDYRPPHVPVAENHPNSYGHSNPQTQTPQQQQQWSATSVQHNQFNGFQSHPQQQTKADLNDPFASLVAASNPSSQPQASAMTMMNQPMQQQQSQFPVHQQQQYPPMGQPTMINMNSHLDPFATPSNNNLNAMGTSMGSTNPDPFAPSADPFAPPVPSSTMNPPSTSTMFDPMETPLSSSMQPQTMPQQQQSYGGQPIAPPPSASMPPPPPGQTPVINGMFLGLDAKQGHQQEEEEEDKELKQAQEAAMYAEEVLRKQKEEKERNKFTLGALAGKAQNLLQLPQVSTTPSKPSYQNKPGTSSTTNKVYGGGQVAADISVDDIEYTGSDEEEERRPPWFAARTTADKETPKKAPTKTSTTDESSSDKPGTAAAIGGAAALGGVAGLIALGPVVGVAAAGAMAIQAARGGDDGILRHAGRAVATVGGAAKRFEDKHGVGKKAASGLAKGVGWAVSAAAGANKK